MAAVWLVDAVNVALRHIDSLVGRGVLWKGYGRRARRELSAGLRAAGADGQ